MIKKEYGYSCAFSAEKDKYFSTKTFEYQSFRGDTKMSTKVFVEKQEK